MSIHFRHMLCVNTRSTCLLSGICTATKIDFYLALMDGHGFLLMELMIEIEEMIYLMKLCRLVGLNREAEILFLLIIDMTDSAS